MEYITGVCCECEDIIYVPKNANIQYANKECIWCGGELIYDNNDTVKDVTIPKMARFVKHHSER